MTLPCRQTDDYLISPQKLHPTTDGNRGNDPHWSTGLNSKIQAKSGGSESMSKESNLNL